MYFIASSFGMVAYQTNEERRIRQLRLDPVDHLMVDHRRVAADQITLVLGVEHGGLDVVAGERADRVLGLPRREGDELAPLALVAPEHPGASVAGSLAVLG